MEKSENLILVSCGFWLPFLLVISMIFCFSDSLVILSSCHYPPAEIIIPKSDQFYHPSWRGSANAEFTCGGWRVFCGGKKPDDWRQVQRFVIEIPRLKTSGTENIPSFDHASPPGQKLKK